MSKSSALTLDTHDACRYLWRIWRILGMNPYKTKRLRYWCYSFCINLCFTVLFPLHMAVQLFFFTDFPSVISNLSITITALFSTLKQLVIFRYSQTLLQQLRAHLSYLDGRAETQPLERDALKQVVLLCHRVFYVYFCAYTAALSAYGIAGYLRHKLPFEGWLPFDWSASESAYLLAYAYQMLSMSMQLIQNATNDTYPIIYLLVMITELRVLNMRIAKVGSQRKLSVKEQQRALVECVLDHRVCMNYFECIRPVIAGTMFLQFLITAFVLCITALGFVTPNIAFSQKLSSGIYLGCVLFEVLPCCWLVNTLMAESSYLTTAIYSSLWYEQDQSFRQSLIIFMQRSQQPNVILAGNLAPVTLQTFIAILRFAFSMFTILSQMDRA